MKISRFEKEFGTRRIGFLIRKFEVRSDRSALIEIVRNSFKSEGFKIVDASEKNLNNETWRNIKEFMDYCSFGVVIIDDFSPNDNNEFNPNIFLEIGYLLALGKNIFILIQNCLERKLPTDVKPFLYDTFDSQDVLDSDILRNKIKKWINNTINFNPGYLNIYFKKEFLSLDFMSEFKNLLYKISYCEIISDKATAVPEDEIKKLNIQSSGNVTKVQFKTCDFKMANDFHSDFESGRYEYVGPFKEAILKINSSQFPEISSPDSGISFLLNSETEAILYCTRSTINNCEEEIDYAKQFFTKKETLNPSEIEIVILNKFGPETGYLYVTNYKLDSGVFPLKMYHHRKKDNLPCLPLNTADILFMTMFEALPHDKELQNNTNFREKYLKAIDLHLDKVKYIIQENNNPIEYGLAKNIKTFRPQK